jgi:hypothetical protein
MLSNGSVSSLESVSVQSVQQMSYSITRVYSIPRVPPGMTASAISHAITEALCPYGTVQVHLVPVNPIFRYGGVQHAARITMAETNRDLKVVYDLESQAHFTLLPNEDLETMEKKQRLWRWRWALRGIVIQ